MLERHIFCGGITRGTDSRRVLHLNVGAPPEAPERVNLHVGDLSKRLAEDVPDVLTDLLEIAAYVYCADQFTTRGTALMTEMGAGWRRQFRFDIPVRVPNIWSSPEISDALVETLSFLSEDQYEFKFVQASHPRALQSYLPFDDSGAQSIHPEEILLFSGGLDSLAGAVEAIMGDGRPVSLVSHRGSWMIGAKQKELVQRLRQRTSPGSFFHVAVGVDTGAREAASFTQRTRSFLFATLGLVMARMFGRNDLSFYENGIVSINLPVAEHVLGARASRTTHPKVFTDLTRLFSLLLSETFSVRNPFIWKTKKDVVQLLAQRQCEDLISCTFSCTRVREATKTGQHCGVCSQCIDRRFGILAAGLSASDPADNYAVDLLTGAHDPGPVLTMSECYVLRAQKLATMSQEAFVATYGQIFRAARHLPGPADEMVRALWEMHQRHGQEVISVVDAELQAKASFAAISDLPTNSLLSMIVSPVAKQPPYRDPIETEPPAAAQAATDTHDYTRKRIPFGVDTTKCKVVFEGELEFRRGVYDLINALMKEHEAGLEAALPRDGDGFRFVKAETLAERLEIEQQSLRQLVSRSRKKLEKAFLQVHSRHLDSSEIIENQEGQGYRLNPALLLVKPAQLRDTIAVLSQVQAENVTTRRAGH